MSTTMGANSAIGSTKAALGADSVYLTAGQLAKRFGVTERTIREWVKRGTLPPPTCFSRKTKRWNPSDIAALLAR